MGKKIEVKGKKTIKAEKKEELTIEDNFRQMTEELRLGIPFPAIRIGFIDTLIDELLKEREYAKKEQERLLKSFRNLFSNK